MDHSSFRMVQIMYFHFSIHDLRVITRYFILDLYTTFQYFTTTHTSCPVSPSGPGSPCFPTGPLEKEDKSDHKKTARHEKILHRLLNEVSTYDRRLYQAHIAGCNPKILCPWITILFSEGFGCGRGLIKTWHAKTILPKCRVLTVRS